MSKPLKPRRGTTAEHAAFIGLEHEVTYDTDKHTLVTHDGLTAGGFPLARADEVAQKNSQQDEAIAGKLDKGGGTMTGGLNLNNNSLTQVRRIELQGDTDGGFLDFHFAGSTDDFTSRITENAKGVIEIAASNGLKHNGNNILTSAGGLIKGTLKLDSGNSLLAQRTIDDGVLVLRGGTDGTSASIQISGKNHPSLPGWIALIASNGTNTNNLTVQPNGTGTLNGKPIITTGNMDYALPDYSAGVTVSSGFTAPKAGLYRHSGINVSGSTYVNGVLVDTYSWSDGGWAGHAGCTLLLSKGDVITYTGTAPSNRKFFPLKGA